MTISDQNFPRAIDDGEVLRVSTPPNNGVPNNPRLPALVYRQALSPGFSSRRITEIYHACGWSGVWFYTVFGYHHFHDAVHEALTVVNGVATLHLGGEDGPRLHVEAGDAVILPAGFGHRRAEATDDFIVAGAYPEGSGRVRIIRADEQAAVSAKDAIAAVPVPASDPLYGLAGPLTRLWAFR